MLKYIKKTLPLFLIIFVAGCFEGPTGPQGPAGPQGEDGQDGTDLAISSTTGTIYNKHYETNNSSWAALRLPNATSNHVVLFVGLENANGVFNNTVWASTIYSNGSDGYDVDGYAGYYVLIYDPSKTNLNKNYQIKYLK